MHEVRPANSMLQRRLFHFLIRGLLFLLGAFLLWRMVTAIHGSSFENINLLEEHIQKPKIDPIVVEVFYESMCPDSKYFIKHQLVPTVEKVPEILDFKLIPYGKAHTIVNSSGIYFTCQHLERECQGNKIHACAVKYVDNQSKLLSYTSCLFNNIRNPQSVAENCATEVGVDWEVINHCSKNVEGSELLKIHGEATKKLNPAVTFIPTITLNESQGNQKDILKNLLKEVCSLYTREKPGPCL